MDQMERSNSIMTFQANIWWRSFQDDPVYGHFKLKRLAVCSLSNSEPRWSVVPVVSASEFQSIEKNRLPFFVATQFGTLPKPENIFDDAGERTVAMFNFSMLSGSMFSITICQFKGSKYIKPIYTIRFPHYLNMSTILPCPFPEVLQVEFGFQNQPPIYSNSAEVARTPAQHFQNLCYRDDVAPRLENLGGAGSMLLINKFKKPKTMHLMNMTKPFELGYFTFNYHQFMTGCGTIPATETLGIGQSVSSFSEAFLLLTPADNYYNFIKRYQRPVDWDGIKLSYRHLAFEDRNINPRAES